MRGFVLSILGLTLLQALLSGRTDTGRIGELATSVSGVLSHVIDPDKPAIPDLRTSATTAAAAATPNAPAAVRSFNSSSTYVT